jgi:hypothetical protein
LAKRAAAAVVQLQVPIPMEDLVAVLREISNSRHTSAIFSPSRGRATKHSR